MSFEKRLQILLDQERYERVSALARSRGVSVAAVIRDAIDHGLGTPIDVRWAALDVIVNAEPCPVPDDPDELVAELHGMRGSRR
ncbi:ribbon-helix-helix domain-containing protein [Actinokineospora sp.]|uniref:ribbon-helix-helix domain-containing protein n=1 Tax=Actinokineospora sp. TaxID=1872133 RepID=UPI004037E6DB